MAVRIEKIDPSNPSPSLLQKAAALIKKGKVIVCPTDTGYAFAANAIDIKAVTRVFILKGRAYTNPIHVAVHSLEAADKYAYMTKAAELLAKRYLPGGLTLVLRRREVIPPLLVAGKDTVGAERPTSIVAARSPDRDAARGRQDLVRHRRRTVHFAGNGRRASPQYHAQTQAA